MKKFLIILIIMSFGFMLFAQFTTAKDKQPRSGYDEKEIMKKQADRYTAKRDYERANTILRELMEKYPDDWELVEKLLTNLMRVSKFDETEELLKEKKDILPEYNYLRLKIPLLVRQGEHRKAEDLADEFIKNNKTNIKSYQQLSQIFTGVRQYEKAADILQSARNMAKDEYLYTLEMARAYQSSEMHKQAVIEYLKHLERNKHYLHYVMNNLKGILNRKPDMIDVIEKFADTSKSNEVKEVLALSLAHVGSFEKALIIYGELETIKLLNFAEEQYKSQRYDIALSAYDLYQHREKEEYLIAEAQIMKAKIYLKRNDLENAEAELLKIYNNKALQKSKYKYRTKSSQQARILLARLAIIQDKPADIVIRYYKDAQKFAFNDKDRKEIAFSIVDYTIKSGNLKDAAVQLAVILQNEDPETEIFKKSIFYNWQIALMRKDASADSLLGELIIGLPDNELTTTALYLTQLTASLDQQWHEQLFEAWRLNGLYRSEDAQNILKTIITETNNDEIKLLLADWQKSTDPDSAIELWDTEYDNELLEEFARLQILENATSDSLRIPVITSFLKENPNSIFAPVFRSYLEKAEGRLK